MLPRTSTSNTQIEPGLAEEQDEGLIAEISDDMRRARSPSPPSPLPNSAMELTENVLTKAGFGLGATPRNGVNFNDGLVGVILPLTRQFITTPNCNTIPNPPLGSTRDLYRREDGRYGEDDPIQYPQPYNSKFAFLTCIPKSPLEDTDPYMNDIIMWSTPTKYDLDTSVGTPGQQEAVLANAKYKQIMESVQRLRNRVTSFRYAHSSQNEVLQYLTELDTTISVCEQHIHTIPSCLRDIRRGVTEIQRAWLYSVALMDYIDKFHPLITGKTTQPIESIALTTSSHIMGAFVWNPQDALALFRAQIPIYYIRPYSLAFGQRVKQAVSLTTITVCSTNATPPYSVIYTGQAGSDDKFAAIRAASMTCFSAVSPFQNMHLPDRYTSSYSLGSNIITSATTSAPSTSAAGPIRHVNTISAAQTPYSKPPKAQRCRNTTKTNSPKLQRDHFADLPPSPISPGVIAAWRDANHSIDSNHPDRHYKSGQPPKHLTLFADPGVFFGLENPARQGEYLQQWFHLREPWLRRCRESSDTVSTKVWRKVLALSSIGLWKEGDKPQKAQHLEHQEATELMKNVIERYGGDKTSVIPSQSQTIPPDLAKQLICELCLNNFRHQLFILDEKADTSRPTPLSKLSQADLLIRVASHRQARLSLIDIVMGASAQALTLVSSNRGLTSEHWHDRVGPLVAFCKLMSTWPGEKGVYWTRGADPNLPEMAGAGEQWERVLVRFYVQAHFNFMGYPPVLPRRL